MIVAQPRTSFHRISFKAGSVFTNTIPQPLQPSGQKTLPSGRQDTLLTIPHGGYGNYHLLPLDQKLDFIERILQQTGGNLHPSPNRNNIVSVPLFELLNGKDKQQATLKQYYRGLRVQETPEFANVLKNYIDTLEKFIDRQENIPSNRALVVDFDDTLFRANKAFLQWIDKNMLTDLFANSGISDLKRSNPIIKELTEEMFYGIKQSGIANRTFEVIERMPTILQKAKAKNITVILVTSLQEPIRKAIQQILEQHHIPIDTIYLHPLSDSVNKTTYKRRVFDTLAQKYNIIAAIGDKDHDMYPGASINFKLPNVF